MPRLLRAAIAACVLLLAFASGTSVRAEAPGGFGGIPTDRLRTVLDRCYNIEADAEAQIAELARDYPDSLVPEFISVARLYWMQAYVAIDPALTEDFERAAQDLLDKAQDRQKENPDDPDTVTLAALSHLALGGYYAEHRRWWSAFWRVRAGRSLTQRVLKEHPHFAEALMPSGVIECYLARTPTILKPLAAMLGGSGSFSKGLSNLREASEHAVLSANDATFYLFILQFDLGGDKSASRAPIESLARRYPRNPFFQRLLGVCELATGKRAEGRARLAAMPALEQAAAFPVITAQGLMNLCWDCMGTGDYAAALDAAQQADTLAASDPRMTGARVNSLFGRAEALKALGRIDEAIACLELVPTSQPEARKRAQARIGEIRREIGAPAPGR